MNKLFASISALLLTACAANPETQVAESAPVQAKIHTVSAQAFSQAQQFSGVVRGYETPEYRFYAEAGDDLSVRLISKSTLPYFNLMAPNADTALFNNATDGERFQGKAPVSGEYKIQVYQMRASARRNQQAPFTLEIIRSRAERREYAQ